MSLNLMNCLLGWYDGSQASDSRGSEMEIRQGKNYYLAVVPQCFQVLHLGRVCEEVNRAVFEEPSLAVSGVIASIQMFVFPVFAGIAAAVNQGDYEYGVRNLNELSRVYGVPVFLPEKLSQRTLAVFSFLAENMGQIFEVSTAVSAVALIALGNPFYGVACLGALTYGVLDRNHYIPYKTSLFMERYMPTVSLFILAAGGGLFGKAYSLVVLPFYVFPDCSQYLQWKIDSIANRFFRIEGCSLEELEAPWVENRDLSFLEIKKILHDDDDYELNGAHFTKHVFNFAGMPLSESFDGFFDLFDSIKWGDAKYYPIIRSKLLDDERFMSYLEGQFPEQKLFARDLKGEVISLSIEKVDECFKLLADRQGLSSKEEAAAFWQRNQMRELVDVLLDRSRVKGSQQDLADAKDSLSRILPYLQSLKSRIDLEDALLKLSVEGGGYCALGIKRTATELLKGAIQAYTLKNPNLQASRVDVDVDYEFTLKRKLQDLRGAILQEQYNIIKEVLPNNIASDVHAFDLYRTYIALGFYPMTEYERREIKFIEFMNWRSMWKPLFKNSVYKYRERLNSVVKEEGQINLYHHIQKVLNKMPLSDEQCDDILAPMLNGSWGPEKCLDRYSRLLWVMLGVMKPKA